MNIRGDLNVYADYLASIEEVIEDARNGRMFILVDAEDRENEGDLVIPAQMCTPQTITFMAMHGRGLICLALNEERSRHLKLPMMASDNRSRTGTAFTVSIEASEGVTTGISAHDRAHTIQVAIDPSKGPEDIATPGHVFPLVARKGGVLVRTGHTEASVDIARLAGLNPSAVICEIMNDDGTMARLPDLVKFAQRHNLKVATIADLISYRRRHDHFIHRAVETDMESWRGGHWKLHVYINTLEYAEHVALVKGDISGPEPVLVRMHAVNLFDDLLAVKGGQDDILARSMDLVAKEGRGVIVLIRDTRATYVSDMLMRKEPASELPERRLKEYGVGAQILLDLGVKDMVLLSNSQGRKVVALEGYGLNIVETRPVAIHGFTPSGTKP
ncbi:MAG: 3,4-dihydroxy-2-butanone-4-phosphate synthase [Alphaproteobacteria bacterium]|nr:3,4-dihydroxy-2-butanone-4-phosphate synthase [Alphaproteobacteria bacterium]